MRSSLLRLWLLTAGVGAGAVVSGSPVAGLAIPLLVLSLAAAGLRRRPRLLLLALFLFGFGSGLAAGGARDDGGHTLTAIAKQVRFCDVTGRILEEAGGLGTFARLERVDCDNEVFIRPGVVALETEAPAGSGFSGSGWILPLGDDRFDVARARAGAHAELAAEVLKPTAPTGLAAVAASVRRGLEAAGEHISPEAAGLLRGLTVGDTDGLSHLTIEHFRRSGLSHLLAVSGSNVAIVLGGVAVLASRFPFRSRMVAGAVGLFLYVVVVGPDASVLRAAAMGAVGLVALATGRQAEPLHALGAALIVIVLLRPQIVFAVGLHLSVAATAGIILWASRLERRIPLPALVRIPLAVTLAAQAAVLPLLAGVFGQASLVAPATNLLATAAVAPATVVGLAGGLAATIDPLVGGAILRVAEPFAAWILFVGRVGAEPQWAMLEVPYRWGTLLAIPVCAAAWWSLRTYGGAD